MADLKISQLTGATTPLAGTEVLPIVQSNTTKKVATDDLTVKNVRSNATTGILQIAGPATATTRTMTVPDANFTAARTDAAQTFIGDQTLGTGNLIQGTAGKGVNFTANTPAAGMTSQLLNWYEEGTWTPVLTTDGTNFSSVSYNAITSGTYTRIGRLVTFQYTMFTDSVTVGSATGNVFVTGLPFTSKAYPSPEGCGVVAVASSWAGDVPLAVSVESGSTKMALTKRTTSNGATSNVVVADVNTSIGNLLRVSGSYFV